MARSLRAAALAWPLALLACQAAAPPPSEPPAEKGDPAARGEVLYRNHGCIACHGTKGDGRGLLAGNLDPKPRDLRDPSSYRQGHTAPEISRTIGMGVLGRTVSPMPSYPHLPRADKDALAAYVVALQSDPRTDSADAGAPRVSGGWIRAVPPGAPTSAAYLTVENPGPERVLEGVSAEGFETVEIHETVEHDGAMGMRPLERLVVPGGGRLELTPGGTHLMLIGPEMPLRAGEERRLTLRFSGGLEVEARLPVRRGSEAAP